MNNTIENEINCNPEFNDRLEDTAWNRMWQQTLIPIYDDYTAQASHSHTYTRLIYDENKNPTYFFPFS